MKTLFERMSDAAKGIEARSDETAQPVRPEGREPGPEGVRPDSTASILPPTTSAGDGELVERAAKADLSRALYARALDEMRIAIDTVRDELEDEGDRVYLGSSNHVELLNDAWDLADALNWDEILAHTQPDTPLAQTNLYLQGQIEALTARVKELEEALTPSGDTKAAYSGEFSFTVEDTDDEWGLPITRHFDVPWPTIKEIMAAIRKRATLNPSPGCPFCEDRSTFESVDQFCERHRALYDRTTNA